MTRRVKIWLVLIFAAIAGNAQDAHFSQFLAAPTILSPSYAGSTDGSRAIINYRNQWPAIPGAFVSSAFSVDHYFFKSKSGLGLIFTNDKAGSADLKTNSLGLLYSYNISINRQWSVRPGINFSYTQRKIDYGKLVFGDQLTFNGTNPSSLVETPAKDRVGYVDFSASALLVSELYWGGITLDHLLEPNQSLTGSVSKVPLKISVFTGTRLFLKKSAGLYEEEYVTLSAIYRKQEKFDQLDLGGYWFKKPLLLGLWYRGMPFVKSVKPAYLNHDAMVLYVGVKYNGITAAYNYDLTISRLVRFSGGAHEISLIYEFNQDQHLVKKRKKIVVPCPKI